MPWRRLPSPCVPSVTAGRRYRGWLVWLVLACWAASARAQNQAAPAPAPVPVPVPAPAPVTVKPAIAAKAGNGTTSAVAVPAADGVAPDGAVLYLDATLNGVATGLILPFTPVKGGLRSNLDNLQQLGLEPARFGLAGRTDFLLDDVPGLSYDYDAGRQTIALRVVDTLRAPNVLSARDTLRAPAASVTPGALVNYDAYSQFGAQRALALFHEVRYFNTLGVFSSSGTINRGNGSPGYVRYDTFWSQSDPDTLQTWQVGDLITSSLSWSRAIRLGGVQWRKNFALRPDLLTFPIAAVGGSAVVPSSLSLYINGVQQYNTNVPSGPFIINQVAGINGAGQATLITRDALGRSVSTTLPLYVDTRMLAAGLTDYSVELGAVRRDYGTRAFGYEHTPVASASGRYGLNDTLTVEGHGELTGALYNAGAGLLYRLGQLGVVSATLAGSAGRFQGAQAGLGYQYIGGRLSIDTQTLRATRDYGDLAVRDGTPVTRSADRVSVSLALGGAQSLSLSYVGYRAGRSADPRDAVAPPAHVVSLAYSKTLRTDVSFSLSGFQDFAQRSNRGLFASLSIAFGNKVQAGVNTGRQNGAPSRSVTLSRAPDFGGGLGWAVQAGGQDQSRYQQAQLQYLGNDGQLTAVAQSTGMSRNASLDLSGALVLMDGSVSAARQVGAGFAMVSTEGIANVPVLHENRQIGLTDSGGHLLVPNLSPYGNNQIGIDIANLPLDARVRTTQLNVVPKNLSGVLALFPVERYSAATVIVHDGAGQALEAGTPVLHVESGVRSVVGYDGVTFIDDLQPNNHLLIGVGAARCAVEFTYQRPAGSALPVYGPLTCVAVKEVP